MLQPWINWDCMRIRRQPSDGGGSAAAAAAGGGGGGGAAHDGVVFDDHEDVQVSRSRIVGSRARARTCQRACVRVCANLFLDRLAGQL